MDRTVGGDVPVCFVDAWLGWGARQGRVLPVKIALAFEIAALVFGLTGARAAAQPAGWDRSVSIEIIAPDHRPDGKTWDLDIPVMLGPAMPNFGDPAPDMMLCVVDAKSYEHCIHETTVNRFGVPLSVCPNVYKCTFANVKVPTSGYFGVLVVDLDLYPTSNDYMLGAILRAGPADPSQGWKIEKALKNLVSRWKAVGAPDEFPEAAVTECTVDKPCFGSSKGGVPSLSIDVPEIRACGMPISGTLEFGPGEDAGIVEFDFRQTENECPGAVEYLWQFGDGDTLTTRQPRSLHHYARAGTFAARMVPRCIRKTSMCEAAPIGTSVSIER